MKRWPIIRHLRWLYLSWRVAKHYAMWQQLGALPVYREHDDRVLDKIWRGER